MVFFAASGHYFCISVFVIKLFTFYDYFRCDLTSLAIGRRSLAVAAPSPWNSFFLLLYVDRRCHCVLLGDNWKAYLFHIWCAGEQKKRSPPVVALSWFWHRIQNCRLTYLLTYLLLLPSWVQYIKIKKLKLETKNYLSTDIDGYRPVYRTMRNIERYTEQV